MFDVGVTLHTVVTYCPVPGAGTPHGVHVPGDPAEEYVPCDDPIR